MSENFSEPQDSNKNYRIVLMNDETFEEINSWQLSLRNIYVLLSTIFVTIVVFVYLIIAYTPLKEYLPGYVGKKSELEVQRLAQEVMELEDQLIAQREYTENFGRILTGNLAVLDTMEPSENFVEDKKDFFSPLKGEISSTFDPKSKHFGIDVLAPANSKIMSTADGIVFFSDWTLETGYTIGIQHNNNFVSFYKHNSTLLKKSGVSVKAGEEIAIIGNTGKFSNGLHLHFELWANGNPVNPLDYISF
jgi:murein DD-endopeptidase MepM/ murein hydrolase activator NlpD